MNKSKYIILTVIIHLICFDGYNVFSQKNSYEVNCSELKDKIRNNILIYRIKNSELFNDVVDNDILLEKDPAFLDLLPTGEFKLKLTINKLDSIEYPLKDYDVYNALTWNFAYKNNLIEKQKYTYDQKGQQKQNYLIAYNKKTDNLRFICGELYKSKISIDFNLDDNKPETFINYLQLKLFCQNISNIQFQNRKRGQLIFSGSLEESGIEVKIFVDRNNFDNVSIKINK